MTNLAANRPTGHRKTKVESAPDAMLSGTARRRVVRRIGHTKKGVGVVHPGCIQKRERMARAAIALHTTALVTATGTMALAATDRVGHRVTLVPIAALRRGNLITSVVRLRATLVLAARRRANLATIAVLRHVSLAMTAVVSATAVPRRGAGHRRTVNLDTIWATAARRRLATPRTAKVETPTLDRLRGMGVGVRRHTMDDAWMTVIAMQNTLGHRRAAIGRATVMMSASTADRAIEAVADLRLRTITIAPTVMTTHRLRRPATADAYPFACAAGYIECDTRTHCPAARSES